MVEINEYTRNGFNGDLFTIGTTSKNKYYPFYSKYNHKDISDNVKMYYKPRVFANYSITKYNDLFKLFASAPSSRSFTFEVKDDSFFIYVMKGFITDSLGKPLMVLGVNTYDDLFTTVDELGNVTPDYTKFKLFVSTEFVTNPIYINVWRKIDKEYVQECHKLGIAVEFNTSENLEEFFFSNEFEVKFDSLSELHEHLNTKPSSLLDEDFAYLAPFDEETTDEPVTDFSNFSITEDYTLTSSEVVNRFTDYVGGIDSYSDSTSLGSVTESFDIVLSEDYNRSDNEYRPGDDLSLLEVFSNTDITMTDVENFISNTNLDGDARVTGFQYDGNGVISVLTSNTASNLFLTPTDFIALSAPTEEIDVEDSFEIVDDTEDNFDELPF